MKPRVNHLALTAWSAVLQWSRVGMNALVFLVLSRWLTLSEIGVVAAVYAPIIVLQSLLTATVPEYVVQERLPTQRRLSTIFWLSGGAGLLLCMACLLGAPWVAGRLDHPDAVVYMRVLGFSPLCWSMAAVAEGLHRKALQTRQLALRTLMASSIGAGAAITAGHAGWGGWAIVIFTVLTAAVSAVITVWTCAWRPSWVFSRGHARRRWPVLKALIGRNLLAAATMPLIQYVTALQLGTHDAGILQISTRIYTLVDSVVMTPYRFVVMPLFAALRSAQDDVGDKAARAVAMGTFVSVPVYMGLALVAPVLLPTAVGAANGLPSVPIVQWLCLHGVLASASPVANQILTARGAASVAFLRSRQTFAFAVVPTLLATMHSLQAVAFTYGVIGGLASLALTLRALHNTLGVPAASLFSPWLRICLAGLAMAPVQALSLLAHTLPGYALLGLQMLLAPPLYAAGARCFAAPVLSMFVQRLKRPR